MNRLLVLWLGPVERVKQSCGFVLREPYQNRTFNKIIWKHWFLHSLDIRFKVKIRVFFTDNTLHLFIIFSIDIHMNTNNIYSTEYSSYKKVADEINYILIAPLKRYDRTNNTIFKIDHWKRFSSLDSTLYDIIHDMFSKGRHAVNNSTLRMKAVLITIEFWA